jgi:hypothetical protein
LDWAGADLRVLHDGQVRAELALQHGKVTVHGQQVPLHARLELRTPDAVLRLEGASASVGRRADGGTAVLVHAGLVRVQPAGRGREHLLLRPGPEVLVQGETAWLAQLGKTLDEALAADKLAEAEAAARHFLAVAPDASAAAGVRLRLAGVLRRTERHDEAAQLLRTVADGLAPSDERDNALALLAMTCRDRHLPGQELATWGEYLERFPHGLQMRQALMRRVELTCGQDDVVAAAARRDLRAAWSDEPTAAAVLARCAEPR